MTLLLFKLFATPALILLATLVSRRFGHAIGGWLVGLPLTSGPIAVYLAIEHGAAFSQSAAAGSLDGTVAQAFFAATYAQFSRACRWPVCLAAASIAFVASGLLMAEANLALPMLVATTLCSLVVALAAIPSSAVLEVGIVPPRWDLPARMAVATALVLIITGAARILGPDLSGLAATYPLFAVILAVFAQLHQGPGAARSVLRGLLVGLFGFVGFFVTVALLVTRVGLWPTFVTALGVNLAIHGVAYLAMRTRPV
jgi:hypothetical protein